VSVDVQNLAPASETVPESEGGPRLARVDLLILAALLLNSVAYVWVAEPAGETARRLIESVPIAGQAIREGRLLGWALEQRSVPPLVPGYLALCPLGLDLGSLPLAIGWLGLAVSLGLAVLAGSLRGPGLPSAASTACLLFLGGFPIVNAFTKTGAAALGGFALVGCVLGLLVRVAEEAPGRDGEGEGLPSWRGACLLGGLLGAATLCDWSAVLHLVGPVLVTAFLLARRPGSGRAVLARLAVSLCVALALAGPWLLYGGAESWAGSPALAEGRSAAPGGWDSYWGALGDWVRGWFAAAGPTLLPLVAAGVLLALWRRPRVTLLLLSSALLPALAMPLAPSAGLAAHLPACPGLAAAASLGLAGLGGAWKAGLLGLLALGSVAQVADRTWSGAFTPCSPSQVYLTDCHDRQFYLLWRTSATARELLDRAGRWAPLLCEEGGRIELAVHPSEVHLGVQQAAFLYQLHRRGRAAGAVVLRTSEDPSLQVFLNDPAAGYPALVVFSELTIRVRAGFDTLQAWRAPAIPAGTASAPRPEVVALEETCRYSRLREAYGILETLPTSCGPVWLLVRRELWEARGNSGPLSPLPPVVDEP
jgi:hypothetical protein